MIRWLKRLLGLDQVYIVLDGERIVAVATTLQGAEQLRDAEATALAFGFPLDPDHPEYALIMEGRHRYFYDLLRVTNHRVQDI